MSDEYIYVPIGQEQSKGGGINMNLIIALLIIVATIFLVIYVTKMFNKKKSYKKKIFGKS